MKTRSSIRRCCWLLRFLAVGCCLAAGAPLWAHDGPEHEIEELTERLRFERERLEKDEAVYAMSDCDAELKLYGTEVHKVVRILRKCVAELDALKEEYK